LFGHKQKGRVKKRAYPKGHEGVQKQKQTNSEGRSLPENTAILGKKRLLGGKSSKTDLPGRNPNRKIPSK